MFYPLARSEVRRIRLLDDPHVGNFFHKWRLLALVICIPCLVMINKHTEQFFLADLIFGGTVVPVSAGLAMGSVLLLCEWWTFDFDKGAQQSSVSDRLLIA